MLFNFSRFLAVILPSVWILWCFLVVGQRVWFACFPHCTALIAWGPQKCSYHHIRYLEILDNTVNILILMDRSSCLQMTKVILQTIRAEGKSSLWMPHSIQSVTRTWLNILLSTCTLLMSQKLLWTNKSKTLCVTKWVMLFQNLKGK